MRQGLKRHPFAVFLSLPKEAAKDIAENPAVRPKDETALWALNS
jgi:hypothetical protein